MGAGLGAMRAPTDAWASGRSSIMWQVNAAGDTCETTHAAGFGRKAGSRCPGLQPLGRLKLGKPNLYARVAVDMPCRRVMNGSSEFTCGDRPGVSDCTCIAFTALIQACCDHDGFGGTVAAAASVHAPAFDTRRRHRHRTIPRFRSLPPPPRHTVTAPVPT